jgi:hypothetical protein
MLIRVFIGIVVIIAIGLGATFYNGYLDQSNAADSTASKIQTDEKTLSTIANSNSALEKEIADINTQIDQAKANLDLESKAIPGITNSNEIVRKIITFGDKNDVTVIPLSTNDWASIKIDKNDYQVFRMAVEVTGPQQNVVDYISRVQDSIDQYLVIEKLDMTNLNISSVSPISTPTSQPIISSFSPISGYTGESIVITGTSFTGSTSVKFGNTSAASYVVNSDTLITAVIGNGASGNISITNSIGTGSLSGFSYSGSTPPDGSPILKKIDTRVNLTFSIYAK